MFVFVGLIWRYMCFVFIERKVFFVCVFQQYKVLCLIIKLLIADDAVLHENSNIIPLLLKLCAVFFEHIRKLVGNLLGNVLADFLYAGITLQITARHVQWNIR